MNVSKLAKMALRAKSPLSTAETPYEMPKSTQKWSKWLKNPINYEEICPFSGTFAKLSQFLLRKWPILGPKKSLFLTK